ncbi:MAG: aminopeptidase P family N-terminal domain-containing protein [Haliscomenobacter sp.]|nr:aminopeptidase P family N-terminal domain-containing protein [Haliscomenobacter sp.]
MTIAEKLLLLRHQMELHRLDACIIPSTDPHQSEYLAAHWKSREWLSGFTGSAGTLVVLPSEAGLWTDSAIFFRQSPNLLVLRCS